MTAHEDPRHLRVRDAVRQREGTHVKCPDCREVVEIHLEGWMYDHSIDDGPICEGSGQRP